MAIDLPAVRYVHSYPSLVRSVSQSRTGERGIATVEYADPFWQISLQTIPLRAADRLLVEAFRDQADNARATVIYRLHHQCIPKAYWGDANNAVLANTGVIASFASRRTFTINSVDSGLTLGTGDLIGLEQGDYKTIARVQSGGVAAGNALTVTVEPLVPGFITAGATVVFKSPRMNMRVTAFAMPDDPFPVASFTLSEVAK